MTVRGVFASHSAIVGDRQNTLSSRILMKGFAGTAPLLALSSGMPEEKVADTNWSWIEDSHISGNAVCTPGQLSTDTTIAVTDSNIWVPNSIIMVEATGEMMFVLTVPSSISITVRRAFAGTTAAAIPALGTLQLIGSAFEEGGGQPSPIQQNGQSFNNFVQIFKNGWAITGTAKAVQYLTGSKLAYSKEMAVGYHAEDIERSFFFGRKGVTAVNGKELRTSNGLVPQLQDYGGIVVSAAYASVGGQMSMAGLRDFMRQIFRKNVKGTPNERIAFTGMGVLFLIQTMAQKDTRYDMTVVETTFGFNITQLNFLGFKLNLLVHPLLSENAIWDKTLYVFHPALIKKKILRPTWSQAFTADNNTNAGVDADSGFIADEMGFELKGADLNGMMTNIQTAVAS